MTALLLQFYGACTIGFVTASWLTEQAANQAPNYPTSLTLHRMSAWMDQAAIATSIVAMLLVPFWLVTL